MFSFVKSTNLDSWNRRQLTFMERGGTSWRQVGNTRALDYFKKCGVVTPTNKHIDYKSAIVQKYKQMLTDEVDGMLQKGSAPQPVKEPEPQPTVEVSPLEKKDSKQETLTNIQNKADDVAEDTSAKVGKKGKKKAAKKLEDDIDFSNFDDGISQAEKERMSKPAEPPASELPK